MVNPGAEAPLPWLVPGDYGSALLHIAWILEGGASTEKGTLLFGFLELVPMECAPPPITEEQSKSFRFEKRSGRIFFKRHMMDVETALQWYAACRTGYISIPNDDCRRVHDMPLLGLREEPKWPALVATSDLPFLADHIGVVRAHHLYQVDRSDLVSFFLQKPEAIDWVSDRVFFHLAAHENSYPEWLGSVHLVAPNPVLRTVRSREIRDDGHPHTVIHVVTRAGHSLAGLHLQFTEYGPTGMTEQRTMPLTASYTSIPHVGTVDTASISILCSQRGVLEWTPPRTYIRNIRIQTETSWATRQVSVQPDESYSVPLHETAADMVIGGVDEAVRDASYLVQAAHTRRARRTTAQLASLWVKKREDARRWVRDRVAEARSRVILVDPYFGWQELARFGYAVTRSGVAVTILTGARFLKQPSDATVSTTQIIEKAADRINRLCTLEPINQSASMENAQVALQQMIVDLQGDLHQARNTAQTEGERLFNVLHQANIGYRIDIVVMTGEFAIHDRFLIVDETVWALGNSLKTLGERPGLIQQVADPDLVVREIQAVRADRARVMQLSEWIGHRQD